MTAAAVTERQPHIAVVFSGLMLVLLLAALDQTIVATALPTIVSDFGGLQHISWVVTAYLLATTAVTPIYGKLGDLYGRKTVIQGAIVLFLLGSALCGALKEAYLFNRRKRSFVVSGSSVVNRSGDKTTGKTIVAWNLRLKRLK